MKREEAIKDLDIIRFNPHWDELVNEEYWQELMEMAIKALEEVQQYRKHGLTVENALDNMCDLAAAENLIEQYRAIGTPEECLQNKDFLDFLSDKMNPNDFETYLRLYNALEEKGCE